MVKSLRLVSTSFPLAHKIAALLLCGVFLPLALSGAFIICEFWSKGSGASHLHLIVYVSALLFSAGGVLCVLVCLRRWITDPLREMMSTAEKLAAGDFNTRVQVRATHEIQDMADTFNTMASGLQVLYENLEYMVAVQTEKLESANRSLELANERLRLAAITDELTGLHNRRYLMESLAAYVEGERQRRFGLSVIIIDADHFKRVNDTYGHDAGDEILRRIGKVLNWIARQPVGEDDSCELPIVAARYGGEEFVLVVPGASSTKGREIAETVRAMVSDAIIVKGEHRISVTVSAGVACLLPSDTGADALLKRADDALYQAKLDGRNRVVVAA